MVYIMSNIISIEDYLEIWTNFSCACLSCAYQWIATVPHTIDSTKLECPSCNKQNSFALEIK